jgi:hypothetical protein
MLCCTCSLLTVCVQAMLWEWGPIMNTGAHLLILKHPAPFLVRYGYCCDVQLLMSPRLHTSSMRLVHVVAVVVVVKRGVPCTT